MIKSSWTTVISILSKRRMLMLVVLIAIIVWCWIAWISPTRIAFIHFGEFQLAAIKEGDVSRFIRIDSFAQDDLTNRSLHRYDALYFFGRGLNLSSGQDAAVIEAGKRGVPIYVHMPTGEHANYTNLDDDHLQYIGGYFDQGGSINYAFLMNYTRRMLDGKRLFARIPEKPFVIPSDAFYHLESDRFFISLDEYQKYYEAIGHYQPGGPRVAFISTVVTPHSPGRGYVDAIIKELESRGINIYPIIGTNKRLEFLKAIEPCLVINVPMGGLIPGRAEQAIEWLEKQNVPLLSPLDVHEPYDDWRDRQDGTGGALMSAYVVLPELEGAIDPYVISAQFPNENGLHVFKEIPERLEVFTERVVRRLALQRTQNSKKRVAIVYLRETGKSNMVAFGLEVGESLYHLMTQLRDAGYDTGDLPNSEKEFLRILHEQGPVLGTYAHGALQELVAKGYPELIPVPSYLDWVKKALEADMYASVETTYGAAPGEYLAISMEGIPHIVLPRIQFGNIVLMPQLPAAYGEDEFAIVHGKPTPPPHPYIAQYLWAREGFKADVLMHFGTHGSLEFTPWKQNQLSQYDWPDALIGPLPHTYVYTINNISEAMIAKRRSYAVILSHLTPPFTEGGLYGELDTLHDRLHDYTLAEDEVLRQAYWETIVSLVNQLDIDQDLNIETLSATEPDQSLLDRIHNYVHSIEETKVMRGFYTLGVPYPEDRINETVRQMTVDALAYSLAQLDEADGVVEPQALESAHFFEERYRKPAIEMIDNVLARTSQNDSVKPDRRVCMGPACIEKSEEAATSDMPSAMSTMADGMSGATSSHDPTSSADEDTAPSTGNTEYTLQPPVEGHSDRERSRQMIIETIDSLPRMRQALIDSPQSEIKSILNALNGGYTPPSSGGDPIVNPRSIPTGRNLFSIDAERTPSEEAWRVGKKLADSLIERRLMETGQYPERVAITLWGGEFIRTQGINMAQALYLLGVEPVRTPTGVVHDVQLIPNEELSRPRIDVVIQTSGQYRDLAASRINLIHRAVELAGQAADDLTYGNPVRDQTIQSERMLIEQGIAPLEARRLSKARVFGGVNGTYGTRITGMVEASDRWEDVDEIAAQYINNMGAIYMEGAWGEFHSGMFETALQNADTVIHSRSTNSWGPLSLEEVYEFMGGLNAAIRHVTGQEPAAYFNDRRNAFNPQLQSAGEAIWAEARSTLLNPNFISDMMEGGSSSAGVFSRTVRNTFGWNVMKPEVISERLWDNLYEVYIDDRHELGVEAYFRDVNPYALQEMTAVMLETIRKGYWAPDEATIIQLADLHTDLIEDYQVACTGFVCDNMALQAFISEHLDASKIEAYQAAIEHIRTGEVLEPVEGMRLEPERYSMERMRVIVQDNIIMLVALIAMSIIFSMAIYYGAARRSV